MMTAWKRSRPGGGVFYIKFHDLIIVCHVCFFSPSVHNTEFFHKNIRVQSSYFIEKIINKRCVGGVGQ